MALTVGPVDVADVKLGATQVAKVMLGAQQVWPTGPITYVFVVDSSKTTQGYINAGRIDRLEFDRMQTDGSLVPDARDWHYTTITISTASDSYTLADTAYAQLAHVIRGDHAARDWLHQLSEGTPVAMTLK